MKKIIYSLSIILTVLLSLSCDKYTDITPKGKNMLNRVSDLDLLLNYNYSGNRFNFMNMSILINDMYPKLTNVPNLIKATVKGLDYTITTYDKNIDRKSLTNTDSPYDELYPIVANVANIVLTNVDNASGDKVLAKQLKAEAYIIRAYIHFLLVNTYAKAYNPATAASDGGIPYVDKIDLVELNAKSSVKEVYEKILADIDAALALNSLPNVPKNAMRVGKGFAHALKGWVLINMSDYAGALLQANSGLAINSTLEDHRPFLPVSEGGSGLTVSRDGLNAPDNLFYAFYVQNYPFTYALSPEMKNNYYESGNIIMNYTSTYDATYGEMLSGLPGVLMWFEVYQQNSAGMTTSDLYMIKAESLIRTGKINEGMDVLNFVRTKRNHPSKNPVLTATSEAEAMAHFKKVSRIEFLFTWKNYVNIKRWNAEGKYAETITRNVKGTIYTLTPDSPLWIFPFPKSATDYNPLLTQNY